MSNISNILSSVINNLETVWKDRLMADSAGASQKNSHQYMPT